MATYTVTPANVAYADQNVPNGIAGEALSAGDWLYRGADRKLYKAQCDGPAEQAAVVGLAVNSAAAGQPVAFAAGGEVTVGALFTGGGKVLALSTTAGKACDAADLVTLDHCTFLGWTTAADKLFINIAKTGLQFGAA